MVELKVYLSENLNEKFRRIAMAVYGYGKGSLSKAAEEAFERWCVEHDPPSQKTSPESGTEGSVTTEVSGINPEERPQDGKRLGAMDEKDKFDDSKGTSGGSERASSP